jgi:hypothetical protein
MPKVTVERVLLLFLLSAVVLVGVLFIIPANVKAYAYLGYSWSNARADFYNDIAGWDPNLITSPSDTWSWAGSPFRFVFRGNNVYYQGDGENTVSRYYRSFSDIARTYIVSRSGSSLYEIDVVINTRYGWGCCGEPNLYDVRNAMTHEFGHWLALDEQTHTWDYFKTMYFTSSPGETRKRTLESDDINGINYIY